MLGIQQGIGAIMLIWEEGHRNVKTVTFPVLVNDRVSRFEKLTFDLINER